MLKIVCVVDVGSEEKESKFMKEVPCGLRMEDNHDTDNILATSLAAYFHPKPTFVLSSIPYSTFLLLCLHATMRWRWWRKSHPQPQSCINSSQTILAENSLSSIPDPRHATWGHALCTPYHLFTSGGKTFFKLNLWTSIIHHCHHFPKKNNNDALAAILNATTRSEFNFEFLEALQLSFISKQDILSASVLLRSLQFPRKLKDFHYNVQGLACKPLWRLESTFFERLFLQGFILGKITSRMGVSRCSQTVIFRP